MKAQENSPFSDPQTPGMQQLLPLRHGSISLSLEQQWLCEKKAWQEEGTHSPDLNLWTAVSVTLYNNPSVYPFCCLIFNVQICCRTIDCTSPC